MPNGRTTLQWLAACGIGRYGRAPLAETIATRRGKMVSETFELTGDVHEKCDIQPRVAGRGGECEPQAGFGWTNRVTHDLTASLGSTSRRHIDSACRHIPPQ